MHIDNVVIKIMHTLSKSFKYYDKITILVSIII